MIEQDQACVPLPATPDETPVKDEDDKDDEKTTDKPPLAGDPAKLVVTKLTATSLTLTWTAGNDDVTAVKSLRYQAVQSTAGVIAKIKDGEAVNAAAKADMLTVDVTGLTPGRKYWFNAFVFDEKNQSAAYESVSAVTPPVFTSLALVNDAADGYVNDAERLTPAAVVGAPVGAGIASAAYALATEATVCDKNLTYGPTPPVNNAPGFVADGTYKVCVRLSSAAGSVAFGESAPVVRDTSLPAFTALVLTGDGSDGYINDAEKANTTDLVTLPTGTGFDTATYAITDAVTPCDGTLTYAAARPTPASADLQSDGFYKICTKLADAAGNPAVYGGSVTLVRDTLAPVFNSLTLANDAADGFINDLEKGNNSDLVVLDAANFDVVDYAIVASGVTCDDGVTYALAAIPTIPALTGDGSYKICVRLSDDAGNAGSMGGSAVVARDTTVPTITTFALANQAADGQVNDGEKNSTSAVATLTGTGHTASHYALVASTITCDASVTYALTAIPAINTLTDGSFKVCARLTDAAANTPAFGDSGVVVRDVTPPTFTSLTLANGASDGYVNDSEKASASALATVAGSDYTAEAYAIVAPAAVCSAATYSLSSMPAISALAADGSYKLCGRLSDTGGNVVYQASGTVVRDTVAPSVTTFALAGGASDGFVNDVEKNSAAALATLSGTGHDADDFAIVSSATTCNALVTYDLPAMPAISALSTDGSFKLCVRLSDAAANPAAYDDTTIVTRDTDGPAISTFALANEATDGYVNDGEKAVASPLAALTATGYDQDDFAIVASGVTCDGAVTYDLAALPAISAMGGAGSYVLCVRLGDSAGNPVVYGTTGIVVKDVLPPSIISFLPANDASDGFISSAEQASGAALAALIATGVSVDDYTVVATGVTCDGLLTYGDAAVPAISTVSSDGAYKVCGRLSDAAGNVAYATSGTITRDTDAPSIDSFTLANEAVGGYINDAEKSSTAAVVNLSATGHDADDFVIAAAAATCDGSLTYNLPSLPQVAHVASDGGYKICVRLTDLAGNPAVYGDSGTVFRDTTVPAIVFFEVANEAGDFIISLAEVASTNQIATIGGTGYDTEQFAIVADSTTCDGSVTYNFGSLPLVNDATADGTYHVCVVLTDAAGNTPAYGTTSTFSRTTGFPVITSFELANEAVGGYVNAAEAAAGNALATLVASTYDTDDYAIVMAATSCNAGVTYSSATVPLVSGLGPDSTYKVCVRLTNASGSSYGGTANIVKDTSVLSVTSFVPANAASNTYINDTEKASTLPLVALTASGHDTDDFAIVTAVTACNAGVTYNLAAIPQIDAIAADGAYKVCVRLSDLAGNPAVYGDSGTITRDTVYPSFTSLVAAGDALDGYINDAEKNSVAAAGTLTASDYTVDDFAVTIAATTCNSGLAYPIASMPTVSAFTADGAGKICVRLADAAGNITYGTGVTIARDTVVPSVTTLLLANGASDALINDGEKNSASAMVTMTGAGFDADDFAIVLGAAACDGTASYSYGSPPAISALASDNTYKVCVRLTDLAGNPAAFAASATVLRDTTVPSVTSVTLINEAVDSYINDAEKGTTTPLIALVGTGYTTAVFGVVSSATACNGSVTYGFAGIPSATDLIVDGGHKVCVKLTDDVGNTPAYGDSGPIVRDTDAPTITSFVPANGASDGYINDTEKASSSDAAALVGANYTSDDYALVNTVTVCGSGVTYSLGSVPAVSAVTPDGGHKICVKLADTAGNATYGDSGVITRDTGIPTITSVTLDGGASDGYINDAEKGSAAALVSVVAAGHDVDDFAIVASATTCNASVTYNLTAIPLISAVTPDGSYKVCMRSADDAGNVAFGGSGTVVRDTVVPSVTTFALANGASDGYINNAEKNSTSALVALTAAGNDADDFAIVAAATTCDVAVTYNLATIPQINAVIADGTHKVCARVTDVAGNPAAYGATAVVTRDTGVPAITTFALANGASDGYVNDSEKASASALVSLSGTGHDADDYAIVSSVATCNSGVTYNLASIPAISALTPDGSYKVCVALTDSAGNPAVYGDSGTVVRDTDLPTISSFVAANGASDGYINDSEKASALALATLTSGGATADNFARVTSATTCDVGVTYNLASIPAISSVGSDGSYKLCVELRDGAGNITYGQTGTIVRDTGVPVLTSLVLANGASDGYVNDSEKGSTAALATLTASGHDADDFAIVSSATTCNSGVTYNLGTVPQIDALSSDASYKVCVRLTDLAGNPTVYGGTGTVVRDIVAPTATYSGQPANPSRNLTLNVTVASANFYRHVVGVSGSTDCTSATYGSQTAVATPIQDNISALADQTIKLCIIGGDLAGNWQATSAATSVTWTNDVTPPSEPATFTAMGSLTKVSLAWTAGSATTGYIIIRRTGSAATWTPTDGQTYTAGENIDGGTHTVVTVSTGLAYANTGLTNDTTYHYRIFAYDALRNYSTPKAVSGTPRAPAEVSGFGGRAYEVFYQANKVYVAKGRRGLEIYDVTTPTAPVLLSTLPLPGGGMATDVEVVGNYAYVAAQSDGLFAVDVTSAAAPFVVASSDPGGTAESMTSSGSHLFVAWGAAGLQILDISTPTAPVLVGSYNTSGTAQEVKVVGTTAYVADAAAGLHLINVSNLTAPTLISTENTPGSALGVDVVGNYAYVADGVAGLQVIDISTPSDPVITDVYNSPGEALRVKVSGSYAYVADRTDGFLTIDISNPINITYVDTLNAADFGDTMGLDVNGAYAFTANNLNGIKVIDISVPSNAVLATTVWAGGSVESAWFDGTYAYVTDNTRGVHIIDMTIPTAPLWVSRMDTTGSVKYASTSGNYAYVSDNDHGFHIYDITNKAAPVLLGTHDMSTIDAKHHVVIGTTAYVAWAGNGLVILNVSNPAAPTVIGQYNTVGTALSVAVSGNYAYIADSGNGLVVINISNPAAPSLAATLDTPSLANGIAVSGGHAYVADSGSGLVIVDVSTPASPVQRSIYNTTGLALDVTLNGTYAYVADEANGVVVLDVAVPTAPVLIATANTGDEARRIMYHDGKCYIGDYASGMAIVDYMPQP